MSAPTSSSGFVAPASSGLAALEPVESDAHASRALTGGSSKATVGTNMASIPSPPATLSVPPNAGVESALKAVPAGIPLGHLGKDALEGPLRDPARFERCRKGQGTRIQIDAVIYNGAALGVTVKSTPTDRALNFCIERIVRDTSWVKELAVNRVSVSL